MKKIFFRNLIQKLSNVMHYDVLIKNMLFVFHKYTFLSNYIKSKNKFHLLIFLISGPTHQPNMVFVDLK